MRNKIFNKLNVGVFIILFCFNKNCDFSRRAIRVSWRCTSRGQTGCAASLCSRRTSAFPALRVRVCARPSGPPACTGCDPATWTLWPPWATVWWPATAPSRSTLSAPSLSTAESPGVPVSSKSTSTCTHVSRLEVEENVVKVASCTKLSLHRVFQMELEYFRNKIVENI